MRIIKNLSFAVLLVLCVAVFVSAQDLATDKARVQLVVSPYAEVEFGDSFVSLYASIPEGGAFTTSLVLKTNTALDVKVASTGFGTAASRNDPVNEFVTYTIARDDFSLEFKPKTESFFSTPAGMNNGRFQYTFSGTFDASFQEAEWWSFNSDLHYFDDIIVTVSKAAN